MRRVVFWLITFAAILGAWFSMPRAETNIPREYVVLTPPNYFDSPDAIAAGRAIFLSNCTPCHGVAGNGQGTTKPTFGPQPADFTDRARMQSLSPQYLFWRVSEGGRVEPFRSQGSIMPAWKYQLTAEQRWQVIAYVMRLVHSQANTDGHLLNCSTSKFHLRVGNCPNSAAGLLLPCFNSLNNGQINHV